LLAFQNKVQTASEFAEKKDNLYYWQCEEWRGQSTKNTDSSPKLPCYINCCRSKRLCFKM